jgi:hypothetical protein
MSSRHVSRTQECRQGNPTVIEAKVLNQPIPPRYKQMEGELLSKFWLASFLRFPYVSRLPS